MCRKRAIYKCSNRIEKSKNVKCDGLSSFIEDEKHSGMKISSVSIPRGGPILTKYDITKKDKLMESQ